MMERLIGQKHKLWFANLKIELMFFFCQSISFVNLNLKKKKRKTVCWEEVSSFKGTGRVTSKLWHHSIEKWQFSFSCPSLYFSFIWIKFRAAKRSVQNVFTWNKTMDTILTCNLNCLILFHKLQDKIQIYPF